jgi:hypothetical protein
MNIKTNRQIIPLESTKEPQLIWGFQNYIVCALPRCRTVQAYSKLESKPPQHNLMRRLSTVVVLGKLRD